jgi:hypothetical protein
MGEDLVDEVVRGGTLRLIDVSDTGYYFRVFSIETIDPFNLDPLPEYLTLADTARGCSPPCA